MSAVSRVDSLLEVGNLELALSEAQDLHENHGDHPRHGGQILARLGVAWLRSGNPAEALSPLEEAIRREPTRPEYHRNLGNALLQLGRKGRALSEYAQAAQLAPRSAQYQLEYGQLLLDFGDHRRAANFLVTAQHLCGDCPEVQIPLARYYLAARLYQQAAEVLMALPSGTDSLQVRRPLIQALQGAQNDSLLIEFLASDGTSDLPADEAMLLVEAEGRMGDLKWSRIFAGHTADAPASVATHGPFWGKVSYSLLQTKENSLALKAADQAVKLSPDSVVYRNNRVVLLTRLGRHEEAADEWERVLELDPSLKEKNKQ